MVVFDVLCFAKKFAKKLKLFTKICKMNTNWIALYLFLLSDCA